MPRELIEIRCPHCGRFLLELQPSKNSELHIPCTGRRCRRLVIVDGLGVRTEARPRAPEFTRNGRYSQR